MVPHTVTHLDLHRQKINQLREDICSQKPQLIEILFNENIIDHIEYGNGFSKFLFFGNSKYFKTLTNRAITIFGQSIFEQSIY